MSSTDDMTQGRPPVRDSLLVLSDSLAYYGPTGGLPADDPRIWPTLVADRLDLRLELFGRIGWTSRDVWWALTQDPRIWSAVPRAKAVVFAFGGMDSLPSPLPTALREQIRYIRPPALRQQVRTAYGWLQPRLSPLGWPLALPPALTTDYVAKIHEALVAVRPDLPIVACLPSTHRSPYYGNVHSGRPKTVAAISEWAHEARVPLVDLLAPTASHFDRGEGNPDGIHWGFGCHREVAHLVGDAVATATGSGTSVAL
jgi:hypothetical protein